MLNRHRIKLIVLETVNREYEANDPVMAKAELVEICSCASTLATSRTKTKIFNIYLWHSRIRLNYIKYCM
jgi:hypothetical protein